MPIRTIHVGAAGRGRWPLTRFQERDDFEAVALVDVSADNLAAARETTGLGSDYTIYSRIDGVVRFQSGRRVHVDPLS